MTKNGLTLTELLVATILVGIVMVGAVSVDMGVRQMREGASRNAVIAMRTTNTMHDIISNAIVATGNPTDLGIVENPGPGQTLCLRIDLNAIPTPIDYTDDTWTCYTYNAINHQINRCQPATPGDCMATDPSIGPATNFNFDFVTTPDFYLEVSITDCFDPSAACGTPVNPEYTLTSRVVPAAHSN